MPGAAGKLRLSVATLTVGEAAGTATVMVARVGGSSGAISVTVSSADGTATAGQDYVALSTTVVFADGDSTPKAVALTIVHDS